MFTRLLIVVIFMTFLVSCTSREEISAGLRSNDVNVIMDACQKIEGTADTAFVSVIFEKPIDWRVSYALRYLGRTVYQEKMEALHRVSGLVPPKPITDRPDSSIVDFYRSWAKAKGLIK